MSRNLSGKLLVTREQISELNFHYNFAHPETGIFLQMLRSKK
jgi:hypothetical protein